MIRECDRLAEEAADPDANVPMRDRVQILGAKAGAVVRLSRVRGEDAISMRKILDSAWWKRIEAELYEALEPHPDAAGAVRARFEALDRAERGGA